MPGHSETVPPAHDSGNRVTTFEDLWIWQEARRIVGDVYCDFGDGTAGGRDFGFRWQAQRAALSIMNNIAEGFERGTDSEFAHFHDIANGSCAEIRSMYYIAQDLSYSAAPIAEDRRARCRQISKGIASIAAHRRRQRAPRPTQS